MEGFGGKEKGSVGNSKKVELFSVVLLEIHTIINSETNGLWY